MRDVKRAAAAWETAAPGRVVRARHAFEGSEIARAGGSVPSSRFRWVLPFAIAALLAAMLLLVPGWVVSRDRMSDVLAGHRGDFTVGAGIAVVLLLALRFLA
jgi:hypothetical protein